MENDSILKRIDARQVQHPVFLKEQSKMPKQQITFRLVHIEIKTRKSRI